MPSAQGPLGPAAWILAEANYKSIRSEGQENTRGNRLTPGLEKKKVGIVVLEKQDNSYRPRRIKIIEPKDQKDSKPDKTIRP